MADPNPAPQLKTYRGNCHCGAFKFNIKIPELTTVTECNCSICFRKGSKWVFPGPGCFTIEEGDGSLKDYEFADRSITHKFCPACSTAILKQSNSANSSLDIAVNARALQDVDLWSLKVSIHDGAAREPAYKPPYFAGMKPVAEVENCKVYTGSCHCSAVKLALKTGGPVSKESEVIGECDCSICARLGRVLTYRPPAQISICLTPGTELSSYSFAEKRFEHKFCPVCGVAVSVNDTVENMKGVNLRCFKGVEWGDIETFKNKGSAFEPLYTVPE